MLIADQKLFLLFLLGIKHKPLLSSHFEKNCEYVNENPFVKKHSYDDLVILFICYFY